MKNGRFRITLRTAFFALAIILMAALPALAASDGVATYRALLIGNSDYQAQDDLKSCAYDLSAMKSALASGKISYKKVETYSNLTKAGIASAVNGVAGWGADDDDVTVVYYTGHGASSGLVGVEHRSTASGIYAFSQLQSVLSNVPGKVIVLMDSCESGGLINKSAAGEESFADSAIAAFSGGLSSKAITSGSKFHVIASSSKDQSSWAKTDLYGLATWALCEAMGWSHNGANAGNRLDSLEGDINGDSMVTVGEAYATAAQAVSEELAKYKRTQDMKAYPTNSGLVLISRAASAPAMVETPKAVYKPDVLNFTKACIAPKKTLQLTLNVPGATNINWASSKNAVATVDKVSGIVRGVKYSYSTTPRISVNYRVGDNWFSSYCDVRVLPSRYVAQSIKFKYVTKTLEKGSSYNMASYTKVYPSSTRYKTLRWSSSNPSVATVHPTSGKISVLNDTGTTQITATATSGVTATMTVTATPARAKSVSLNYKTRTLIPGQSFVLTQTVMPAVTKDKSVTWKSSKENIATVDDTGMVTANTDGVYGKTVISATTENNRVAYCTVTVVRNQSIPRTKPKSAYGKLTSSARRIYESGTGSLVVDMFFYNRTGSTKTIPMYNPGIVVLKLKNGTKIPIVVSVTDPRPLRRGYQTIYTFRFNYEDYPNLAKLDLRGSDAWYEARN